MKWLQMTITGIFAMMLFALCDTAGAQTLEGPDYPTMMKGWKLRFDDPWLAAVFNHESLWFVQDAAVESLRDYSDRKFYEKKKPADVAADVGKSFFRKVALDAFNMRFMPKKIAIDLDVGDVGSVNFHGTDVGALIRLNADF